MNRCQKCPVWDLPGCTRWVAWIERGRAVEVCIGSLPLKGGPLHEFISVCEGPGTVVFPSGTMVRRGLLFDDEDTAEAALAVWALAGKDALLGRVSASSDLIHWQSGATALPPYWFQEEEKA